MRVLVVENDPSVGDVVREILAEAGHGSAVLAGAPPDAVRAAVEREEPDCVLLADGSRDGYGASWEVAAWLRARLPPVPAVMFTVHTDALVEVRTGASDRSRHFAGAQPKPFDVDELVAAVAAATSARPQNQAVN